MKHILLLFISLTTTAVFALIFCSGAYALKNYGRFLKIEGGRDCIVMRSGEKKRLKFIRRLNSYKVQQRDAKHTPQDKLFVSAATPRPQNTLRVYFYSVHTIINLLIYFVNCFFRSIDEYTPFFVSPLQALSVSAL